MSIAAGIELPEAEIVDTCRRPQVRELSLFGSAARGEMRPDSDIDLLVRFTPERSDRNIVAAVGPACNQIRQLLGTSV
jgi:predicted nucleotidyltransferase